MNTSEKFVFDLISKACLKLWTYNGPRGKEAGKELCDVLVACFPDLIVISVKEIALNRHHENLELAIERWKRKAIDGSIHQVYGAVRRLLSVDVVTKIDGEFGVTLGSNNDRRIHRIAVAIGAEDLVPLESTDHGQGFVHVFNAETLFIVMEELDTITDFTQYLVDREKLLTNEERSNLITTEADLLAFYIKNGRTFHSLSQNKHDLMLLLEHWEHFSSSIQYQAQKRENKDSYIWDTLINKIHEDHLLNNMDIGGDISTVDQVTRIMAKENRVQRRIIAKAFLNFMSDETIRSRIAVSSTGTTYVFLKTPHIEKREDRITELTLRAWAAREKMEHSNVVGPVVGIATELPSDSSGFSLDTLLLNKPNLTDDDRKHAQAMCKDLDFFQNSQIVSTTVEEFPSE